jgi:hypothetical protein
MQTKHKFDENSTLRLHKYTNHEIQNKKLKNLSKIRKLHSLFDFHTKRPKLQNREIIIIFYLLQFFVLHFNLNTRLQ